MDENLTNNQAQQTTQSVQNPSQIQQTQSQSPTLSNQVANLQDKWTDIVKGLNDQMKNLQSIDGLLNEVYSKRQEAVDLWFGMNKILNERQRDYKGKVAVKYNFFKSGQNGLRYTNENAISIQIESQLQPEKECIDILANFTNFMSETLKTIDNIIYGINNKIKIYELLNGVKY